MSLLFGMNGLHLLIFVLLAGSFVYTYIPRGEDVKNMTFGGALVILKAGNKMTRTGWNGKGMYICLQNPDADSRNTLPYLWMRTAAGERVPWLASQTDMLAEDWQTVTETK